MVDVGDADGAAMATSELAAEPTLLSAWWTSEVGRAPALPFDGPAVPRDLDRDDLTGAVVVLRAVGADGETTTGPASVTRDEGHQLVLAEVRSPIPVGAAVAVIRLAARSSLAVPTTVVARAGDSLVMDVLDMVCRVDQRSEIRHRVTTHCTFSSGNDVLSATTINVSAGGAMIVVADGPYLPPGTSGLLTITSRAPHLATILHTTPMGDGWQIRLAFASPIDLDA